MRVAVVGHVEWVTFLRVDRALRPGVIAHADAAWDEPAGGGGVAAVELARLAGRSTLYTALGDDAAAGHAREALTRLGVDVRASTRQAAQRRAVTLVDPAGERTIIVHGPAQEPRGADPIGLDDLAASDGVYLCKGDAAVVLAARRARVLVATARMLPILREAGVVLDALVHSGDDEGERYADGDLNPAPRLLVTTEGGAGGRFRTADGATGRFEAAPLPGPTRDAYGAGDSFAAGLTWALAAGHPLPAALAFAAGRGAAALCRAGAHGGGTSS